MLNEEFDPYELLVENANHIDQVAKFVAHQGKLIEQLTRAHQDHSQIIVDLNTRLNAAQHRISRLERQNAVIIPPTKHSK
jgi:hypothetical protein